MVRWLEASPRSIGGRIGGEVNVESDLHEATGIVRDGLARQIRATLTAFPTAQYVTLLDAHPAIGGYKYRSREFLEYSARIKSAFPMPSPNTTRWWCWI
jgi:hypothetical protein